MVKRYWKETGQVPSEVGEHPDGDYVKFADYDAAQARIRELEAENERLLSLTIRWSKSCTGRHGSQSQCVESCSANDRGDKP